MGDRKIQLSLSSIMMVKCQPVMTVLTVVEYLCQFKHLAYVPVDPELGTMMSIQGESNDDVCGHISVDYANKTVNV